MPTYTDNYNLPKPGGSEAQDVAVLGEAMDKIDAGMKANADNIGLLDNDKAGIAGAVMTSLTATGIFNGMRIRTGNGEGAGLFPYGSCIILLLAIDGGTPGNFLLAIGSKGLVGSPHNLNTIANSVLELGVKNDQGSQVIVGGNPVYVETVGISIERA